MANNTQNKRNANGAGSVRQRDDGRWEARCTINGNRRSFYANTQREALKCMRNAQNKKDIGLYFEPTKLSFEAWLDIWLEEYVAPNVKTASYNARKFRIEKDIKPFLGKIKLSELNSTQIQMFYNHLLDKRNLSPGSIKGYHATISSALSQAEKLKYIILNPAAACKPPKCKKKEISPLSEKDISAFLEKVEHTEQYPYRELFKLALFSGMRRGEICGLSWDNIDFKDNTITIKQQLCFENNKKDDYYIGTTKNEKTRVLAMAPFIADILKKAKQEQMKYHMELGMSWDNKFNLVFTEPDGSCISASRLYSKFKKIACSIERNDARFHDLRHSYAVISLQEGDDPKTVQQNLGHSSTAFTLNVYAHVSETMKQKSAKNMQNYYEKIKA